MTKEKIAEVKTWVKRMGINLARAITLAARMPPADLQESNDLFWALVKYTENVQESAKQLDAINNGIFPALIEISEGDWRGLKGMRDRLAHAFWNIDPQILWSTVTEDFPDLYALLATLRVIDDPLDEDESFVFEFSTDEVLRLPNDAPELDRKAGHSLIVMRFGHDGQVEVFRVIHDGFKGTVMYNKTDSLKDVKISHRPAPTVDTAQKQSQAEKGEVKPGRTHDGEPRQQRCSAYQEEHQDKDDQGQIE